MLIVDTWHLATTILQPKDLAEFSKNVHNAKEWRLYAIGQGCHKPIRLTFKCTTVSDFFLVHDVNDFVQPN